MPNANRFGAGCCCGSGPPDPGFVYGCFACGIPKTITLTWYWFGYNQDPCTTGAGGACQVYGPRTDTLVWDAVTGHWISGWTQSPCTPVSESLAGFPPFGCLYQRFTWNCASTVLAIDFSDTAAGTNVNSCGAGVHQQTSGDILASRSCPFFTLLGIQPPPVGSPCGFTNEVFASGSLSP